MPTMDDAPRGLEELSQVNFGLIIDERVPVSLYKSEWFYPPYDAGIKVLLEKGAAKEDVAKVVNPAYINDAHEAVCKWNGIGESFNWAKALQTAYDNFQRGDKFVRLGKKLKENQPVDILPLYGELSSAIANEGSGLKAASDIDYKTYKPFMKCGYAPIDHTLGGIPSDGPIIIYGVTGVGKSKFATALVNGLLHEYPEKRGAIYTLEMNEKHWLWRTVNLFPDIKEVLPRLHVSGQVRDMEELVAEVTAGKFDFVVLDDMDNMVKASEPSEYERIYRRVKEVCRFMSIPFFVLGQPNREAKWAVERGERFLSRYDIAWSGAGENSAALQIALQTLRNGELDMDDESFPTFEDPTDYIIFWKSRDGWPGDYDPSKAIGPGAVVMEHSPNWNGNPVNKKWKLWSVESGSKKMSKKKSSKS